ncbi:hypothetical protein FPQ18DRAFT_336287 [Pyronema domesticum]|nr:hypothetical protein FPQ18DRAFT_336287 [Pyronema domesticum]
MFPRIKAVVLTSEKEPGTHGRIKPATSASSAPLRNTTPSTARRSTTTTGHPKPTATANVMELITGRKVASEHKLASATRHTIATSAKAKEPSAAASAAKAARASTLARGSTGPTPTPSAITRSRDTKTTTTTTANATKLSNSRKVVADHKPRSETVSVKPTKVRGSAASSGTAGSTRIRSATAPENASNLGRTQPGAPLKTTTSVANISRVPNPSIAVEEPIASSIRVRGAPRRK